MLQLSSLLHVERSKPNLKSPKLTSPNSPNSLSTFSHYQCSTRTPKPSNFGSLDDFYFEYESFEGFFELISILLIQMFPKLSTRILILDFWQFFTLFFDKGIDYRRCEMSAKLPIISTVPGKAVTWVDQLIFHDFISQCLMVLNKFILHKCHRSTIQTCLNVLKKDCMYGHGNTTVWYYMH